MINQIKVILVLCFLVTACDGATKNVTPVGHGDPTKRRTKKEKAATITSKFRMLGIVLQCPTDCVTDYEESLQNIYYYYNEFSKRRGRILQVNLEDTDLRFNARTGTMKFPKQTSERNVTDMFAVLDAIEKTEKTLRMRISFPVDVFRKDNLDKAIRTLRANSDDIGRFNRRIQWIDFSSKDSGCADKTWTLDRDDFENRFASEFDKLKKCLGAKGEEL